MGARQREISVSEFFTKNRHLLGFDNPRKALLTCVKEAVDNALDACEEAGILPEVAVQLEVMAAGSSATLPASQATRFMDLGTTVSFNLGKAEDEQSRFAGRATNTRIRTTDARRFRTFLEQEGEAFLERIDEWLSRHEAPVVDEETRSRSTVRVGAGVYGIQDERKPP